jgi:hypothetical protein
MKKIRRAPVPRARRTTRYRDSTRAKGGAYRRAKKTSKRKYRVTKTVYLHLKSALLSSSTAVTSASRKAAAHFRLMLGANGNQSAQTTNLTQWQRSPFAPALLYDSVSRQ